jgi:hypothetical protein
VSPEFQLKNHEGETLDAWDRFGDSDYTYSHGVAIADDEHIGLIWIVQDD